MCSEGAVNCGEGHSVPAQSGGGALHTGEGVVLPAPPYGELQTAMERQPGSGLLHCQTQR